MSKAKPEERAARVRFRAEVLAEADRSSGAAVARKYQLHQDTIRTWRKQLETDEVLAREYADVVARLSEEWREPVVRVMRAALERMEALIPEIEAGDLRILLDVVREHGSLIVQADALSPAKERRGSAPDREGSEGPADAGGARAVPVH